jgi:3'-phosphoadenosine 5'-phosphosulfate sulfotransferase (PAPS reductase)/FAD synthetase
MLGSYGQRQAIFLPPQLEPNYVISRLNIRSIVCSFSGGKDSLVATHYTWRSIKDKIESGNILFKVVHVNTTVELPKTLEYVRDTCKQFGWDFVIVRPAKDFFEIAKRKGMPTRRGRWCCYNLKLEPLIRFTRSLPPPRLQVTGYRIAESTRRQFLHKSGKVYQLEWRGEGSHYIYSPIFYWKDDDVERYIEQHKLPINPNYAIIGMAGDCVCGVYVPLKKLQKIARAYPEFIKRFEEWERSSKAGGSAFYDYINRKKIYVRDLLNNK